MTPPLRLACQRVWARRRPLLFGELLVVLCLLRVYDYVRAHAEVRAGAALSHGWQLLGLEGLWRIDVERTLNHWAQRHDVVTFLANHWYQFAHIPVTLCVLAWVWVRYPESYRRSRNTLVFINVLGLAVFLVLPVAPPRLLPGAGFIDSVANAGFGHAQDGPIAADQYGAMPSLHLAWAVWCTVVVRRIVRRVWWRRSCVVYPVITTIAVVLTGNHYLLDVVVGIGVALFAFALWPVPEAAALEVPGPVAVIALPAASDRIDLREAAKDEAPSFAKSST